MPLDQTSTTLKELVMFGESAVTRRTTENEAKIIIRRMVTCVVLGKEAKTVSSVIITYGLRNGSFQEANSRPINMETCPKKQL